MKKPLIVETTRYDVLRGASPEPWKTPMSVRIQGYSLRFQGVKLDTTKKEVVVKFETSAPGHSTQHVFVQLCDFWDMWEANLTSPKKLSLASILNLIIMHGDIRIYCTCPSWVYGGYKYMATELDYAYGSSEKRFPKVRNPKLLGTLCKHAFIVVKALPYQKFGIESALRKELAKLPESTFAKEE